MTTTDESNRRGEVPGVPEGFHAVREGSATVLYKEKNETYYSPVQEFNRDLSVAVLSLFSEDRRSFFEKKSPPSKSRSSGAPAWTGVSILEALSATGLRSIRYAKEIPNVSRVLANDLDPVAVESIKRNVEFNGLGVRGEGEGGSPAVVEVSLGDASVVMAQRRSQEWFDVVDLDPYGSPAPFLDTAVQVVKEGGVLCVTFTDMAVLAGPHMAVCFTKYGSMPIKRAYCHEEALRIAVACVECHANRHRRHVTPLLALSVDYYIRLFLRVETSATEVNKTPGRLSFLVQCSNCDSYVMQPLARQLKGGNLGAAHVSVPEACQHCGSHMQIGGPIWSDPIMDVAFVDRLLKFVSETEARGVFCNTRQRLLSMLGVLKEELADVPLFYSVEDVSRTLKISAPPRDVLIKAFSAAGHRMSVSHTDPQALKTDAPSQFLWDVMRAWAATQPAPKKATPTTTAILSKPSVSKVVLEMPTEATDEDGNKKRRSKRKREGAPRFLPNPEANWGPGSRAGRKSKAGGADDKTTIKEDEEEPKSPDEKKPKEDS